MKKLVIIGALTLAIGASMTAGTMARYTQELGTKTGTVTTKKFNATSTLEDFSMKIAPGETTSEKFKVNLDNVETNMNLRVEASVDNESLFQKMLNSGAKLQVTNNRGFSTDRVNFDRTNGKYYCYDTSISGEQTGDVEYTISLDWPTDLEMTHKLTQELQGKTDSFKVRVVATQN